MLMKTESAAENFEIQKACLFAHLSQLAYLKFEDDRQLILNPLKEKNFELVEVFNHKVSKTQGYLAKGSEYAVLCFRGTEHDYMDILTDLKVMLKDSGHQGFFSAYESVRAEIEEALKMVQDLPLYVTGHSLGGALAKVAVLTAQKKIEACYTFGSPAICTKEKVINNSTPVFLVVNSADVVPRALNLGPIIAVLGELIVKFIRWLYRKIIEKETPNFDGCLTTIKTLQIDTVKYAHFGTIHHLDDVGKLSVLKNENESKFICFKIILKNYKKCFEDHSINHYIHKLEQIAKEP